MLTAGDRNLAILDASSTNCVEWPSVSMLDLSPADFCELNSCGLEENVGIQLCSCSHESWVGDDSFLDLCVVDGRDSSFLVCCDEN